MEERTKFKAELFWMDKNPINTNQELILRCSTQETTCTIKKIIKKMNSSTLEIINENTNILKETEVGELIIETKKPIMIEKFNNIPELGRFVLVRNNNTSAGGIVTNF
jgi:sulfate adenylyltransferase subunit 1 (EFTu-like GTPase family)